VHRLDKLAWRNFVVYVRDEQCSLEWYSGGTAVCMGAGSLET
jgi:hypothetical protein